MKTREEKINDLQNQVNAKIEVINCLTLSIHHYPELVAEVDTIAGQRDELQAEIDAEKKAANYEWMEQNGMKDIFDA